METIQGGEWDYYDKKDGLIIHDYRGTEKEVTIPAFIGGKPVKAVRGVGEYLYYRWGIFFKKGVESVIISEGVDVIQSNAFNCGELSRVRIPASVTRIESGAFCGNRLTAVAIPEQVTHIGEDAFSDNKLAEVTIPPGVHTIGKWAFAHNCLTRAVISPGICVIGEAAFAGNRLADISIPDSVTAIGEGAFTNNELTGIDLPASIASIGSRAFSMNRLTAAFAHNLALKSILVDPENPAYTSVDGVLFSKEKTTLVSYPAGRGKEYAIPDGVTVIDRYACAENQLEQVFIPRGVTFIGKAAFSDNQITSVTIPPGVKTIGSFAFSRNKNLSRVIIGMDVEIYYDVIDGDFVSVYKSNGKKAGEYAKTGDAWSYAPLDHRLMPEYFEFKTAARVKAKKAKAVLKKTGFVLAVIVFIVPQVCFTLVLFLIKTIFRLIISIPRLLLRRMIRLFRKFFGRHNSSPS
jgi:hypothetical protein